MISPSFFTQVITENIEEQWIRVLALQGNTDKRHNKEYQFYLYCKITLTGLARLKIFLPFLLFSRKLGRVPSCAFSFCGPRYLLHASFSIYNSPSCLSRLFSHTITPQLIPNLILPYFRNHQ